eukprot:897836-Pleurochrysis_carterae.AAC.1
MIANVLMGRAANVNSGGEEIMQGVRYIAFSMVSSSYVCPKEVVAGHVGHLQVINRGGGWEGGSGSAKLTKP